MSLKEEIKDPDLRMNFHQEKSLITEADNDCQGNNIKIIKD